MYGNSKKPAPYDTLTDEIRIFLAILNHVKQIL